MAERRARGSGCAARGRLSGLLPGGVVPVARARRRSRGSGSCRFCCAIRGPHAGRGIPPRLAHWHRLLPRHVLLGRLHDRHYTAVPLPVGRADPAAHVERRSGAITARSRPACDWFERRGLSPVWLAPALWVTLEWLRGWFFIGFPVGRARLLAVPRSTTSCRSPR